MRQEGTPERTVLPSARSLVAIYDWAFLLGPGFFAGVGNGLILGYLMYRSGLVPRGMAMLGLIGGPLLCRRGSPSCSMSSSADRRLQALATIPEFFWELSLGIYLIVKGFRPSPILETPPRVIQERNAGVA